MNQEERAMTGAAPGATGTAPGTTVCMPRLLPMVPRRSPGECRESPGIATVISKSALCRDATGIHWGSAGAFPATTGVKPVRCRSPTRI
ncbi:hypothetical protein DPMN_115752 [Dreissena polymorpha]|uniref:Uncharacterized protein n=1 Tax=Dreissena polymorpha TaxID=45954 RepID=A0A9D4KLS4_DREPO|nr:hypothetical protein DPMN_115752 [Dreissena polymorpha]